VTTVCLTFDFDAVSLWVGTFRQSTATAVSRGEYGARVGLPRVLDVLTEKEVVATFFVPAHTAVSFPTETRRIADAGHEIGVHGDCHETPVGLSREAEGELLDRSVTKLREVLGTGFRPLGYRSPAWDLSSNSVGLLLERGYLYDSSMMADDFTPYRAREGDVVGEDRFVAGAATRLVEMPVAWELDDFPSFTFLNKPLFGALKSVEEVFGAWAKEFDYCRSHVEDGVFTLTMHPQVIGRGPRILMLAQLIDYMKSHPGVRFSTLAAEAARRDTMFRRNE
jgi:peptidoglycan/xylan/chitin deacetylase (PgdA/CDA1 family)